MGQNHSGGGLATMPKLPTRNIKVVILSVITLVLLVGMGIYYLSTVGADAINDQQTKFCAQCTDNGGFCKKSAGEFICDLQTP